MTRDGENGTKTGFYPVLVQMCAPVQTISFRFLFYYILTRYRFTKSYFDINILIYSNLN